MRVSKFKRAFCLVFAVMLILGSLTVPAFADDDATTGGAETSFYKLSSVASTWFADSMARTDGVATLNTLFDGTKAGNVGGLLGYADEIDDSGLIQGWIASALSMSSATISYSSFGDDSVGVTQALKHYANYGRVLRLYGFDGMATEGGSAVRVVAGGIIKIAYWLSLSVEFIFNGVIKLLQIMNPFRFVMPADGIYQIPQTQTDAFGDSYQFYHEADAGGALYELSKFLGGMYASFQDFGVTFMIPFLLFILISSILLTKDTGSVKHKVFVYVRRAVIIIMGVPICTSIYTTMLNQLALDISANQGAAQRIILSTFLDFESWAESTQLKMPVTIDDEGVDSVDGWLWLDAKTGSVGGASIPHLRDTCYAINMSSWTARGYFGSGAISWSGGDTMNSGTGGLGAALKYTEDTLPGTATSDAKLTDDSVTQIGNLIDRYMGNECYHSGDFESYVKSKLNTSSATYRLLTESPPTKVSEFKEHTDEYFGSTVNELWNNGGQLSKQSAGSRLVLYSRAAGLSTMSMYNYLSTKFDASSMTVYSNEKASSGLVRPSHLSVNLIGTTVVDKFLNWARALMMLLTVAVIGWFYGFSMIMSSVKRSIMTIMHIPFVALGGLKSTARVVLQMTLMIIEVVATIIAYRVLAEIALSLDNLFGNVFLQAFTRAGIVSVTGAVWNVFTILLIVTNVLFLIVALKLRKSIVKSFDEQAKELIDRLFGVNSGPTGNEGPGMGARVAGAAAAGAGAGLAHKMMSGGGGEGNVRGVSGSDGSRPPMPPLNTDPPGGGGEDERNALAGEDARALPGGGEDPAALQSGPDDGSSPGGGASFDSEQGGDDNSSDSEFKNQVDNAESLDDLSSDGAGDAAVIAAASDGEDGDGDGSDVANDVDGENLESEDGREVAPGDAAGGGNPADAGDGGQPRPPEPEVSESDGDVPVGDDARGDGPSGGRPARPGDGGSGSSSSKAKSRPGEFASKNPPPDGGKAGAKPGSRHGAGSKPDSGTSGGKPGDKPGVEVGVKNARPADASGKPKDKPGDKPGDGTGGKPGSGSDSGEGRKSSDAVRRAEEAAKRVAPAEADGKPGSGSRPGDEGGSRSGGGGASGSRPGETPSGSNAGSGTPASRNPRPSSDGSSGGGTSGTARSGSVEEARARRDALAAQRDALAAQLGERPGGGVSRGGGSGSGSSSGGGEAVPRGVSPDAGVKTSGFEPAGDAPATNSSGGVDESRKVAPGAAGGGGSDARNSPGGAPGSSGSGRAPAGDGTPNGGSSSGTSVPPEPSDGVRTTRSDSAGGAGPTGRIPGSERRDAPASTSGAPGAPGGGREDASHSGRFGDASSRRDDGRTGGSSDRRETPGSGGERRESATSPASGGGSTTTVTTTTTTRSSGGGTGPSASRVAAMAAASSLLSGSDNPLLRSAGQGMGMATQAHVFGSARRGAEETTTTTTRTERPGSGGGGRESVPPDASEESIESYDAESEQLRMQIENLRRRQAEERSRSGERRRDGSRPRKSLRRKD